MSFCNTRPAKEKLREIADQIHIGAMAFMRREYSILFVFAAIVTVALWLSDLGMPTAVAFVVGADMFGRCRVYRHVYRHQRQCANHGRS